MNALRVTVTDDSLAVDLSDGRSILAPVAWYPRLLHGSSRERNNWRLIAGGEGIHWPDLDEDVSVESIILGRASAESQASLKRWLESRDLPVAHSFFEAARAKYLPDWVKLLFIAEAPPASESERFFYFEKVDRGDALFLEMMKVIYPKKAHFDRSTGNWKTGYGAKWVRSHKAEFLRLFSRDGFYLIDAVDEPMPENAKPKVKRDKIRSSLTRLKDKVAALSSGRVVPGILIGGPGYSVCATGLKNSNVRVLNHEMINTPARGGMREFRRKLHELFQFHQVKTSDGSED